MAQLRQGNQEFLRRETVIVVVGPEGPRAFTKFWDKHGLPFSPAAGLKPIILPFKGLPDPEHTVLKRFGQEVNLFKLGRMPAQVLVDKEGIARFAHYGHGMSDIPPNQEILELLDGLSPEGNE